MRTLDPGHRYELASLDGGDPQELRFVKRIGADYPGNEPPAHPGTTVQEVLRALLDRLDYVDRQRPCDETKAARGHVAAALVELEQRVRRERGQEPLPAYLTHRIDWQMPCPTCGHVQCLNHGG